MDKLTSFGTNYSPSKIYISPSAGGYGNTNYFFDDVRIYDFRAYTLGACASNGVVSFGANAAQITYVSCTNCWNYSSNLVNNTNVAGYMSWGYHSGWLGTGFPTNGALIFHGNSGWHIIQTIESYNGQWVPIHSQTGFHDYFAHNAFGGRNYSNTPVGAISHTFEPGIAVPCGGGVSDPFLYFGLWHARRNFGVCAWLARRTERFQAVGDPFVVK